MKRSTMRLSRRTSIIAGITAAAVLAGGGVAFAFWTSSGSGTASAQVASSAGSLTVSQSGSVTGLYPGGAAQPVSVVVTNPTSSSIFMNDVAVAVTGTEKPAGTPNPGCTAANFAITDNAAYNGELIAAGASTLAVSPKNIAMVESGVNQDACKGAVVVLTLTAS